jgi:hypothetical protein
VGNDSYSCWHSWSVGAEQPPKTQTSVVQAAMALGVAVGSGSVTSNTGRSVDLRASVDPSSAAAPLLPHPSAASESITISAARAFIETSVISPLKIALIMVLATRALPIVLLVALLGGACGSSSTAKSDGGGDHPTSSNVVAGTIAPGATPPCITQALMLVGGQAQCTVVQHRIATGGVIDTNLPSCFTASQGPCWSLITSPSACPSGGLTFTFDPDPADPNPNPSTLSYDYSCQLGG